MRQSVVRGNWGCMLMDSPDSHPIIGRLDQYEGLFCMAGDSGTSFKTSPAIGKCLTELITEGRATTVDLFPFRATVLWKGNPGEMSSIMACKPVPSRANKSPRDTKKTCMIVLYYYRKYRKRSKPTFWERSLAMKFEILLIKRSIT